MKLGGNFPQDRNPFGLKMLKVRDSVSSMHLAERLNSVQLGKPILAELLPNGKSSLPTPIETTASPLENGINPFFQSE